MASCIREIAVSSTGAGVGLAGVAVVIPAWEPDARLVGLVEALAGAGFGRVVVVDDGSSAGCAAVFEAVGAMAGVELLRHGRNRGKGMALKTGFRWALASGLEFAGVVTADADGQHRPEDVRHVAEVLLRSGSRPVLGVRRFGAEVPARSRWGNELTRKVFRALTGVWLEDTQTGLRGLPRAAVVGAARVRGARYEYEMAMLAELCGRAGQPVEVPIATVYLDGNHGSHFRPVRDSARVYGALMRWFARHWLGRMGAAAARWAAGSGRWVGSAGQ